MEVVFNFGGFYHSHYDDAIDSVVYDSDEENTIDADAVDFKKLHIEVSKRITEKFNEFIDNEFGCEVNFKFLELQSPTKYNFSTDKIILEISESDKIKLDLLVINDEDIKESLISIVTETTTSKSGYIPFYEFKNVMNRIDEDNSEAYYQCLLDALMDYDKDEFHNITLDNLSETISNNI